MLFLTYTVLGIVSGCLYALTATGLVVTYTTSGIFNFAHGAMGMFMAFVYWQLAGPTYDGAWGWPVPVALVVTLFVFAPLFGALIERVAIRPLYGASLSVSLVVTLGLMLMLLGAADWIWPPRLRKLPAIFGNSKIHVAGLAVSYYQFMVLAVAVLVAVGLRIFFTRTRMGLTMKAVVDDRDLTARAGASPFRISQISWAMGASLAALAGILIAPLQQFDQFGLTFLVIVGYSAAVVGRMKSLPLTVAGAMVLALLQAYAVGYLPVTLLTNLNPVLPTILLFVAVLFLPQDRLSASRPVLRRVRQTMRLLPSLGLAGGFVGVAIVMTAVLSAGNLIIFGQGVVLGVVMLSLVLLSGYGGQVSLCQMTIAGLGAYMMGKTFGGDSVVGLVLAVVVPAAVGAVLAVIVVRLKGLYLALATLAFAEGMDNLFFNRALSYGGGLKVGRFLFHGEKGFVIESTVIFALVVVGVLALRRGPFGRLLSAMNDSESACASIGMSVMSTKVAAFAIASGIAGLGGALYGGLQGLVSPNDFGTLVSLTLLLSITLAGIDTVAGAVAASAFYALQPTIQKLVPGVPTIILLAVGLGAVTLGRNQGGITGQLSDAVEALRRLRRRPGGGGPVLEPPLLAGELAEMEQVYAR